MQKAFNAELSAEILLEKYAKGDETSVSDVMDRVATALSSIETDADYYRNVFKTTMVNGFIPAGRINSAAGTGLIATLINCFVVPIKDSIDGIYGALHNAAQTMRRGGGVGYDFTPIRPKNAPVIGTQSSASGPVSYMRVYDRSCETVESAGARRGAQMGMLSVHHPDIKEFIFAKSKGDLKNFNISVAMTDMAIDCYKKKEKMPLYHAAKPSQAIIDKGLGKINIKDKEYWIYEWIDSDEIVGAIMRATYETNEPGIIFIDRVNADNNLNHIEEIHATNPCAEQPLPANGCCCLGSINLTKYVNDPFTESASFNFRQFVKDVKHAVRMLDNTLDITHWPLEEQRQEAMNKRRIGLGYTGLGDALIMLCIKYDSSRGALFAQVITKAMLKAAYYASMKLAKEKGAFKLYHESNYINNDTTRFISRHLAFLNSVVQDDFFEHDDIIQDVTEHLKKYGIRNSHLLSIAPTGTISLAFADNASNGIEPPFSYSYTRKKRMPDGTHKHYQVIDYAYGLYCSIYGETKVDALPDYFRSALQIAPSDHVRMLAAVAPYIDTAISKTVNVDVNCPFSEFENLYMQAYEGGVKGLATYRPNAIMGSVLSVDAPKKEEPTVLSVTHTPPDIDISAIYERPEFNDGNNAKVIQIKNKNGGKIYLVISHLEDGVTPFEILVNGDAIHGVGAFAKSLSIDLRTCDRKFILNKLKHYTPRVSNAEPMIEFVYGNNTYRDHSYEAAICRVVHMELKKSEASGTYNEELVNQLFTVKENLPADTWSYHIYENEITREIDIHISECLVNGVKRPYKLTISGGAERYLHSFAKLLSVDMCVLSKEWIMLKLSKLINYSEENCNFMAPIPGSKKRQTYPSLIAYIATIVLYRYKLLGDVNEVEKIEAKQASRNYKPCNNCGSVMIKKDGCTFCQNCGNIGECG